MGKDHRLVAYTTELCPITWRLKVQDQGFGWVGSFWGLSSWPMDNAFVHIIFLLCGSLCPNFSPLSGHQACWIRAHPNHLILTSSPLQRPCLQLRSYAGVLGIRTPTRGFWGDTIQPLRDTYCHAISMFSSGGASGPEQWRNWQNCQQNTDSPMPRSGLTVLCKPERTAVVGSMAISPWQTLSEVCKVHPNAKLFIY